MTISSTTSRSSTSSFTSSTSKSTSLTSSTTVSVSSTTQTLTSTSSSSSSTSRSSSTSSTTSRSTTTSTSRSTTSSTTTTSSTLPSWCRRFWASAPAVENCDNTSSEDWCLERNRTWHQGSCPGIVEGRLLCPAQNTTVVEDSEPSCTSCATVYLADSGDSGYSLSGELRWGPNTSCEVEETVIDGYQVWLLNECGDQLEVLGSVDKKPDWQPEMLTCCDVSWYAVYLGLTDVSPEAAAFAIVPYRGAQTFGASVLPILHRTPIPTTTVTTSTSTGTHSTSTTRITSTFTDLSPVRVDGCLSVLMADPSEFEDHADLVAQAIQAAVSSAAGAVIQPEYVQHVSTTFGQGCLDADARRRLQDLLSNRTVSISIIFAVLIPPYVPDRQAVAQNVSGTLELLPPEQASQLLNREMQKYEALENVTVTVQAVVMNDVSTTATSTDTTATSTTATSTSARLAEAETAVLPVGVIIACILTTICLLVLIFVVLCWRMRRRLAEADIDPPLKRKEVTKEAEKEVEVPREVEVYFLGEEEEDRADLVGVREAAQQVEVPEEVEDVEIYFPEEMEDRAEALEVEMGRGDFKVMKEADDQRSRPGPSTPSRRVDFNALDMALPVCDWNWDEAAAPHLVTPTATSRGKGEPAPLWCCSTARAAPENVVMPLTE
eukprot:s1595_g4.t1